MRCKTLGVGLVGFIVGAVSVFVVGRVGNVSPSLIVHDRTVGLLESSQGNCAEALSALRVVVDSQPSDVYAVESLGNCEVNVGEYSSGLRHLKTVADTTTKCSYKEAYARGLWFSGETARARSALVASQRFCTDVSNSLALAAVAVSYAFPHLAVAVLQHIPVGSRNYNWWVTTAQADTGLGEFSRSTKAFDEAVRLAPRDLAPGVELDLANQLSAVGDCSTAIPLYYHILPLVAYPTRGVIYSSLGADYEAIGAFAKSYSAYRMAANYSVAGPARDGYLISAAQDLIDQGVSGRALALLHMLLSHGLILSQQVTVRAMIDGIS